MKKKLLAIVLSILLINVKIANAEIAELTVDLNDKESCRAYIAAVCEETVKILSLPQLPSETPNYDLLKQAVESLSNGRNVVILDDLGYPSIMYKIPQIEANQVLPEFSGVHPMFIVEGKAYPAVYIGKYEAIVLQDRAYSLPNVDPTTAISMDVARTVCMSKGTGWHLTSNIEFAALAYICHKHKHYPHGNTNAELSENYFGDETGRITQGYRSETGKLVVRRMATGSGPVTWTHDGTENGIYDLNGNVWEYADGIRLVNGQIQLIKDNDVVLQRHWNNWQAISAQGNLVSPRYQQTWHIDSKAGENEKYFHEIAGATPFLSLERTTPMFAQDTNHNYGFGHCQFKDFAAIGGDIPKILQLHAIAPLDFDDFPNDGFWVRNYGIRRLMRGGMWMRSAGLFGSSLAGAWNDRSAGMGFRISYIDLEDSN